jgi:PAS domain S-box-containing protein
MTAFLGVPLLRDGKVLGLIAVANREGGYGTRDLEVLEALAPAIVQAFLRRRAEEALRRASEQRRLAMEAAELGAWDYRFESGEVFWDEACRNMFGVPAGSRISFDEVISRIHPEDAPATREDMGQAISGGGAYHREYRVVWPDGSVHWIASHGRVKLDGQSGRPVHLTGLNMDITDRKHAELEIRLLNTQLEQRVQQRTAQLETANQELEAFAYSVSHDLRAPLRGIDGWSLALAEDYAGRLDKRALEYLDRVRSETQRMGRLIDDMLHLSRVTQAQMQIVPVDLSALAHHIGAELRDANARRRIEFAIAPGLDAAGDPRLLEIALTNLFANAVKFTGPRAEAHIEFGRETHNGRTAFYVRDNGVGFDAAYAGTLFRAFQRLHTSSEFPGTGIGLATVQRVIHRHGGQVWAESQLDRGATFFFTIGETA